MAHISEATDEAAQLITSLTSDNFEEIVSTLDLEEVFCDRIAIEYLIAFVHDGQFFERITTVEKSSRLPLAREVMCCLTMFLCNMPSLAQFAEHWLAVFELGDNLNIGSREDEVGAFPDRLGTSMASSQKKAAIRLFFAMTLFDVLAVDTIAFRSLGKSQERQFIEYDNQILHVAEKYKLISNFNKDLGALMTEKGNADSLASISAIGRLVATIAENSQRDTSPEPFDLFSFLVLGFVTNYYSNENGADGTPSDS